MQVYFCLLFFFQLLDITGFVPMESITKQATYGSPVTLDCNENEKPVSYIEWLYKNKTMPNAKENRIFSRDENTTKNTWEKIGLIYSDEDFKNGNFCITIRSITYEYEGKYRCRTMIKEMDANTKSKIILEVVGWYQSVKVEWKNILNIPLHSNESVNLYFLRNGTKDAIGKIEINAEGKVQSALKERYSNRSKVENEMLKIHFVTFDDDGDYMVEDKRSGKIISTVRMKVTCVNGKERLENQQCSDIEDRDLNNPDRGLRPDYYNGTNGDKLKDNKH